MSSKADAVNNYDIVIVGAGPAGLMLSTCLARWGYRIKHIDKRPEPTLTGRADGIQPRSLDILRNMDLKSAIMAHRPAKVFEVAFWDPSSTGTGITRSGTWASCPDFIDARYPYTTLLHQGLIERVFIADLERHNMYIQRPWAIKDFSVTFDDHAETIYPVKVEIQHVDQQRTETVQAKYLFGAEGARSFVRSKLGIELRHKEPIVAVWGVMDGVVVTDFPDIKMKCTVKSQDGSLMVIPRENNMVRLYIQIASSAEPEWDPHTTATVEEVQNRAKRILQPYKLEWEHLEWYSVYPIGQGISDNYTLDQRVFLGGDACHTHSPKAGQGMNTAFMDSHNLAWKIHLVEAGLVDRSLLTTYEIERKHVAERLISFDSKYAKLFSSRPITAKEVERAVQGQSDSKGPEEEESEFVRSFKQSCEFTSGYGVSYLPNILNWSSEHPAKSPHFAPPGSKLVPGRLFLNATVTRVVDANVVHLEQEVPLNGSFRIFVFAGGLVPSKPALESLASGLTQPGTFFSRCLRRDVNAISHKEKHNPHSMLFTFCLIFAAARNKIDIVRDVPKPLASYHDHIYADDRRDSKVADTTATAHAKMGFSNEEGGVVVVRPDGYVACVIQLVQGNGTIDALNAYFASFCGNCSREG